MEITEGVNCEYYHASIDHLNDDCQIEDDMLMMLRSHLVRCQECLSLLNEAAREVIGF